MNQEQNNANQSNSNIQYSNGISNNQSFNTTFNQNVVQNTNVNYSSIDPQTQQTSSYQQPINQIDIEQPRQQSINNVENTNNQSFNNYSNRKRTLWLIIALIISISMAILILILIIILLNKKEKVEDTIVAPEIYAKVYMLSEDEGGRYSDIFDGYSGVISINNGKNISANSYILENKVFDDGKYYLLRIELKNKVSYKVNDSIDIYEGGRLIGIGEIVAKNFSLNQNDTYLHKTCKLSDTQMSLHINATYLSSHYALIDNYTEKVIIGEKEYYGIVTFDDGVGMLMKDDVANIYINLCEEIDVSVGNNISIIYNGEVLATDKIIDIYNKK